MKILIVDDSTINNILLQNYLEDNGFEVDSVLSGVDAIEILSNNQIDLVLLDIMMPDFSGFDFLNHLKSKNMNIPVIVITANIDQDYKNKALELGAKEYITKPIELKVLLERIKKVEELSIK